MIMRLGQIRFFVQHASFLVLMYGGRFGVHLGYSLPCFACPYVAGCGGACYLMGLQGYFIGLAMPLPAMFSMWGLKALGWLLLFVLLVAVLGKTWCGWICPFGTLSDWLGTLRRKLGVRESRMSPPGGLRLGWIKYALLAYLAVLPPFVAAGLLPPDFSLPFCNICPGKSLLPLFAGETRYLALDFTNSTTLAFSVLLVAITGIVVVGMFFRDRFFCAFCPLLALMHLLKPVTALRLVKEPDLCIGCGTCRRVCAMEVERVYLEKEKHDVQDGDCTDCLQCVETCAADRALGVTFLGKRIFSSSRRYASRLLKRML